MASVSFLTEDEKPIDASMETRFSITIIARAAIKLNVKWGELWAKCWSTSEPIFAVLTKKNFNDRRRYFWTILVCVNESTSVLVEGLSILFRYNPSSSRRERERKWHERQKKIAAAAVHTYHTKWRPSEELRIICTRTNETHTRINAEHSFGRTKQNTKKASFSK